eukprot:NODE_901_length_3188_cov_1.051797.p1 type:complete len:183 gc:universal NODE_901_length_3188_cov_1.051797:1523-2071(+)
MLFIQMIHSATVATCWAWAYYYYYHGKLSAANYYTWIADCCVYGTQPDHWEDGVDGGDDKGNKHPPTKFTKIPLDIPDSAVYDDGNIISVQTQEYNSHNVRIYKYMRVDCLTAVAHTNSTDVEGDYSHCINSYKPDKPSAKDKNDHKGGKKGDKKGGKKDGAKKGSKKNNKWKKAGNKKGNN